MRIAQASSALSATQAAAGSMWSSTIADRVSISFAANLVADGQADHLASVSRCSRRATYELDPARTAEEILEHAEAAARIRALFAAAIR